MLGTSPSLIAGAVGPRISGLSVLLNCRPLLVLSVCATLFHFANAPMLQLVGQKLAFANAGRETALMSACVIAAQLVMLPMGSRRPHARHGPV